MCMHVIVIYLRNIKVLAQFVIRIRQTTNIKDTKDQGFCVHQYARLISLMWWDAYIVKYKNVS